MHKLCATVCDRLTKLYAILADDRVRYFASSGAGYSARTSRRGQAHASLPIIEPVDAPTEDRAAAIRDHLRDAIVDRRLAPGTKLSEAEVGTLFDVSRTVVRAALQMLSFEGLVRTERNRGAFVANPTPEEARQVFASRRLIEPGIAAEACARIEPRRHRRASRRSCADEAPLSGAARPDRPPRRDQGLGRFSPAAGQGRRQRRSCCASWRNWWRARRW